jgi:hypothetical protein
MPLLVVADVASRRAAYSEAFGARNVGQLSHPDRRLPELQMAPRVVDRQRHMLATPDAGEHDWG